MKLPFTHAGHSGTVDARVAPNKGGALLGRPFAKLNVDDFPKMRASVSYSGEGYHRYFAWVQLVDINLYRDGRTRTLVDVFPSMIGFGVPFAAFGDCPTFFDAPATTVRRPGFFAADAFLCDVLPLVDRKKPVRPLAGFRWGYSIDTSSKIHIHGPELVKADAWNARLALLRKTHPRWIFSTARL
jgi:hypothetical protein